MKFLFFRGFGQPQMGQAERLSKYSCLQSSQITFLYAVFICRNSQLQLGQDVALSLTSLLQLASVGNGDLDVLFFVFKTITNSSAYCGCLPI